MRDRPLDGQSFRPIADAIIAIPGTIMQRKLAFDDVLNAVFTLERTSASFDLLDGSGIDPFGSELADALFAAQHIVVIRDIGKLATMDQLDCPGTTIAVRIGFGNDFQIVEYDLSIIHHCGQGIAMLICG